ncbi:MATE family efflux transporter [Kallipyga massiliensis]|uniref:MATE family efflux transporter n=1 Tax=Kallipyga massiliensis TaxID=1472764 RepID=UPI0004BA24AB|nr:MATE family efflux transporter [Kallipyga massiliensis]
MKFLQEKKFYKQVYTMAWPAVLESFFINLAGLIDTMMVAGLGPAAVAATGLTNQPYFILLTPLIAVATALSALVARRMGEGHRREANTNFLSALVLCAGISLAITLITLGFADRILEMAGSNRETHDMAVTYFHIYAGGSFFVNFTTVINAAQRGSGNTRIAFTTNLVSSLVNIIFNYLLIYGHLGFPRLGVMGAALATIIGQAVSFLMATLSVTHRDSYIHLGYCLRRKIRPKWEAFRSLSFLGGPIMAENLLMRVGFLATALMAAGLGTEAFAVHQVNMNLLSMGFSLGLGMQTAAMTLAGKSMGAGKEKEAIIFGKACRDMGYGLAVFLALAILALGPAFYHFQFADDAIAEVGVHISLYVIAIVFFQIQQLIYNGILRSAGDVKFTLVASLVSVTLVRTLMTILLVRIFHLGLDGIWWAILIDQTCRFLFSFFRFRQGKWIYLKI